MATKAVQRPPQSDLGGLQRRLLADMEEVGARHDCVVGLLEKRERWALVSAQGLGQSRRFHEFLRAQGILQVLVRR
jgi:hypothetical protein